MAIQIQNFSKKNFGPPNFTLSCSTGWTSDEQQILQHLPKKINFKVQSLPQLHHEAKHLGLRLPDQDSSSTMSIGQSHNETCAMGGTNSHDQSVSSESGMQVCVCKFSLFLFQFWLHMQVFTALVGKLTEKIFIFFFNWNL